MLAFATDRNTGVSLCILVQDGPKSSAVKEVSRCRGIVSPRVYGGSHREIGLVVVRLRRAKIVVGPIAPRVADVYEVASERGRGT